MPPPLENSLRPLPYHEALANYLHTQEPATWAWFDSAQAQENYAENLRLDLLKQTYRLDAAAHAESFAALDEAKAKLGLGTVPSWLYQSQLNQSLNASLYFLPGELHVVLSGAVLDLLDARELRGLFGHELAHYVLWSDQARRFLITDRATLGMANDQRAEPSHVESARLLRLYTEIYADRGALLVTGDPAPVISGLVKMATGLTSVDPASYRQQADEIFAKARIRTEGISHPETFIRARAVALWAEGTADVETEITRMIEGTSPLDQFDLVAQQRVSSLTRRWLQELLRPAWFQTDSVRAHARMFFDDFDTTTPGEGVTVPPPADDALFAELREQDLSVRDYFCYLLLDFATIDPELEQQPLRAAFALAERVDWGDRLEALATKELKLKKRDVQKVRAEATNGHGTANGAIPETPEATP